MNSGWKGSLHVLHNYFIQPQGDLYNQYVWMAPSMIGSSSMAVPDGPPHPRTTHDTVNGPLMIIHLWCHRRPSLPRWSPINNMKWCGICTPRTRTRSQVATNEQENENEKQNTWHTLYTRKLDRLNTKPVTQVCGEVSKNLSKHYASLHNTIITLLPPYRKETQISQTQRWFP